MDSSSIRDRNTSYLALLNRWLESFANRVSISPLYFLMGGGIVLAITLLTVGWHSYRAASSNPVKSLRSE